MTARGSRESSGRLIEYLDELVGQSPSSRSDIAPHEAVARAGSPQRRPDVYPQHQRALRALRRGDPRSFFAERSVGTSASRFDRRVADYNRRLGWTQMIVQVRSTDSLAVGKHDDLPDGQTEGEIYPAAVDEWSPSDREEDIEQSFGDQFAQNRGEFDADPEEPAEQLNDEDLDLEPGKKLDGEDPDQKNDEQLENEEDLEEPDGELEDEGLEEDDEDLDEEEWDDEDLDEEEWDDEDLDEEEWDNEDLDEEEWDEEPDKELDEDLVEACISPTYFITAPSWGLQCRWRGWPRSGGSGHPKLQTPCCRAFEFRLSGAAVRCPCREISGRIHPGRYLV